MRIDAFPNCSGSRHVYCGVHIVPVLYAIDVVVFQINANSNIVAGSMKGELVYQDPFDSSVGGKPCDDVVGMGAAVKSYIDYMGYAKASELSRHCVRCDL